MRGRALVAALLVACALRDIDSRFRWSARPISIARWYALGPARAAVAGAVAVLVLLTFAEDSGPAWAPWAELGCYAALGADLLLRRRMRGGLGGWNTLFAASAALGALDALAAAAGAYASPAWRVGRLTRGVAVLQSSKLTRGLVRSAMSSIAAVVPVLCLLSVAVLYFALLGVLLFGGEAGFGSVVEALVTLSGVLSTVAFPQAMIAVGASPLSAGFFIAFEAVCHHLLLVSLTLSLLVQNYRRVLAARIRAGLLRRRARLRAAFVVLAAGAQTVTVADAERTLQHLGVDEWLRPRLVRLLDADGSGTISLDELYRVGDVLQARVQARRPPAPTAAWAVSLRRAVRHRVVDWGINLLVVVSGAVTVHQVSSLGRDPSWAAVQNALTVVFALEIALKCLAHGSRRFLALSGWNRFDAGVVGVSVLVALLDQCTALDTGRGARAVLFTRTLRLLRVVGRVPQLQALANGIAQAAPVLLQFAGLLLVLFLEFGIVGMAAFGGRIRRGDPALAGTPFDTQDFYDVNFDTFGSALVALFVFFSGKLGGNARVLTNGYVAACGGSQVLVRAFFLLWYAFSVVLAFNLVKAVVLEVFLRPSLAGDGAAGVGGSDDDDDDADADGEERPLVAPKTADIIGELFGAGGEGAEPSDEEVAAAMCQLTMVESYGVGAWAPSSPGAGGGGTRVAL